MSAPACRYCGSTRAARRWNSKDGAECIRERACERRRWVRQFEAERAEWVATLEERRARRTAEKDPALMAVHNANVAEAYRALVTLGDVLRRLRGAR